MKLKHIGSKLSIVIILGILLIGSVLLLLAMNIANGIVEGLLGEKALSIAITTADHIDGDEFEALVSSGDDSSEFYIEQQQWMHAILVKTESTYLYTMNDYSSSEWVYVIDGSEPYGSDDLSLIGDTDTKDAYGQEPINTYSDGIPRYSEVYDAGEWGMLISSFAPIRNSSGDIVGIVGADVSADVLNEINAEFIRKLMIGVIILLIIFIILFLIIVRQMLTNPIAKAVSYSN